MILRGLALGLALAGAATSAFAQSAQGLFSARATPSPHGAHPVGLHARGCLAGGVQLPESGPTWQAMRLSRNHNWGHPQTIAFIERLSAEAARLGWNGLYVGDLSQPRGGPVKGHASHQTGLDIDVWMLPPGRLDLTASERERLSSISVRSADQRGVNGNWTAAHARVLEAAARDRQVERIFVTPPAKLRMCADTVPSERGWLRKIRPWWGHDDHFHVRLNCPASAAGCRTAAPLPPGDGCSDVTWWVTDALAPPDPDAPAPPPRPTLGLADLPPQCSQVLSAR